MKNSITSKFPYIFHKILRNSGHSRWITEKVSMADFIQTVYMVWIEMGQPEWVDENGLNFAILNKARAELRSIAAMGNYECCPLIEGIHSKLPYSYPDPTSKYLEVIIDYYENHTADETIQQFHLPDTRKIRKLLSQCLPKPERKSGKTFGEQRVKVETQKSMKELMGEGVPKATAWRAAQRGYYYKKES